MHQYGVSTTRSRLPELPAARTISSYMGEICTHSWLRSFWEMISRYKLDLVVNMPPILLPRENDFTIMYLAVSLGFTGDTLRSINRCHLICNDIFLSCVSSANGLSLDQTMICPATSPHAHSRYNFQEEDPSDQDWLVWDRFWTAYCLPDGTTGFSQRLGGL